MGILVTRGLAVAAGLIFATAGGATVVSAAATPSSPASPNAGAGPAHRPSRAPSVAGEVASDSSSGGTFGAGQLVLKEPDGTQVTIDLASQTKAWKYQGHGVKPTSESPSGIPTGEIVVARGRTLFSDHVAVRIMDLGFKAAS